MNKFILMTRVLEPFITETFVHTTSLIKTFLLGSYASKISMRSYIEHHQEGRFPKKSTLLTKSENQHSVTNILRLSTTL